jgi:TonB family protein
MRLRNSIFLAASLFLHILVFASLFYKKSQILENPQFAVSLNFKTSPSPHLKTSQTRLKQLDKNVLPVPPEPIENKISDNSTTSSDSRPFAYESGNVTARPRILKQIRIPYPPQAKAAHVEGIVRLSVTISEMGEVSQVKVIEGPGYGLNEAAQEALKQYLFSPAELAGEKVAVRIDFQYRFNLETR